jgi:hypothetical protein
VADNDLEDIPVPLPHKSSSRKDTKKEATVLRPNKFEDAGRHIPDSLSESQEKPVTDQDFRREISGFLRQESISPQRSKEEKIIALLALGSYLDD